MRARFQSSVALRRAAQASVDACLVALAYFLAYVLRFDSTPQRYDDLLLQSILFVVVGKLAIFYAFGLYHKLWRFIDQQDFEAIVKAVVTASVVLQRHVPIEGRRGVRVIARRAPRGDRPVQWVYEYDEGIDPTDPVVQAAAAEALDGARADVGPV